MYWELHKPFKPKHGLVQKALPEEMHLYSPEAEEDLVECIRKMARELLEDWKGSHSARLWPHLEEQCREIAEERIGHLRLFFRRKRTGLLG